MGPTASRVVLLVGQHPSARDALAHAARLKGWSARAVETCGQALGVAAAAVPDCLVVEQHMSDGSALELMRRLRASNPELRAVMVSRNPSIAAAVLAIREGFRDYRATPVDGDRLLDVFEERADGLAELDAPEPRASLEHVEWSHIQAVLADVGGNVSRAARVLGLHRRSLQRRLQRTRLPTRSVDL